LKTQDKIEGFASKNSSWVFTQKPTKST